MAVTAPPGAEARRQAVQSPQPRLLELPAHDRPRAGVYVLIFLSLVAFWAGVAVLLWMLLA